MWFFKNGKVPSGDNKRQFNHLHCSTNPNNSMEVSEIQCTLKAFLYTLHGHRSPDLV